MCLAVFMHVSPAPQEGMPRERPGGKQARQWQAGPSVQVWEAYEIPAEA